MAYPEQSTDQHVSQIIPLPPMREVRQRRAFPVGYMVILLVIALGAGIGGGFIGAKLASTQDVSTKKVSQQVISNESQLISSIAKNVGDSVVSVNATTQVTQTSLFGQSYTQDAQAAGTGIIISESGYVVTNRHVVDSGTTKVSVTLSDGTQLDDVSVVGRTTTSDSLDIAVLKINNTKGKKLTVATLGDSSQVAVGDKVVAIGNALGQFQNTVTAGIVSGYGRSIEAGNQSGSESEVLQNLLQTDTAINSGNSGGPLVSMNGEVIGINTAVASGAAENIGFAIPINDVKGLLDTVIATGKFQRPYLGVRYVTLTDAYAYQNNLSTKRGAYVAPTQDGSATVIAGGPAAKAGIKEKDIITKVNGLAIDEHTSLTSLIGRNKVGDMITLTVIRDGKEISVSVKLESYS